jgi:hypothetical protein
MQRIDSNYNKLMLDTEHEWGSVWKTLYNVEIRYCGGDSDTNH